MGNAIPFTTSGISAIDNLETFQVEPSRHKFPVGRLLLVYFVIGK